MLKAEAWLVITATKKHYWRISSFHVTRKKPLTGANEVAIRLDIELPETLFEVPQLSAAIKVPESATSRPVISADVQDNIAAALRKQLGMKVTISVPAESEES